MIKYSLKLMMLTILLLSSTLFGEHYGSSNEYDKGSQSTHYQDQSEGYYTWTRRSNVYFKGGNLVTSGYFSSYDDARDFANTLPEVTRFFFVGPNGLWITTGFDYATDTELLFSGGYAEFFSGGRGVWYPTNGQEAHGYVKQTVIPCPNHYLQEELRVYLEKNQEVLDSNATSYLEMDVSLEEAFTIADNDPLITHFIVMQEDNYFDKPPAFELNLGGTVYPIIDWSKSQPKETIVFFSGAIPLKYNNDYRGGIWIYSKK